MRKKAILLQLKAKIEKNAELNSTIEELNKDNSEKDRALKILNERVVELQQELSNSVIEALEEYKKLVAQKDGEISQLKSKLELVSELSYDNREEEQCLLQQNSDVDETVIEQQETKDDSDLKHNMAIASVAIGRLVVSVTKKCNTLVSEGLFDESRNLLDEFSKLKEEILFNVKTLSTQKLEKELENVINEFSKKL